MAGKNVSARPVRDITPATPPGAVSTPLPLALCADRATVQSIRQRFHYPLTASAQAEERDAEWIRERNTREASDVLDANSVGRWAVCVVPPDNEPRLYFMRGTLEQVRRRASAVFGPLCSLTIEPASHGGPESIDVRLNLSTENDSNV